MQNLLRACPAVLIVSLAGNSNRRRTNLHHILVEKGARQTLCMDGVAASREGSTDVTSSRVAWLDWKPLTAQTLGKPLLGMEARLSLADVSWDGSRAVVCLSRTRVVRHNPL